jgi:DNA-3-methyladenine glycosylase
MFGPPGYAYVYFTYGMHFCVNVVCMPEGIPRAVLLRAGRVTTGEDLARRRRALWRTEADPPSVIPARDLARGPARLCQALAINRTQNGLDMCSEASELRLRLADPGLGQDGGTDGGIEVAVGPRVGVSAAADVPWRYWIAGDPTVSPYRPHKSRVRQ